MQKVSPKGQTVDWGQHGMNPSWNKHVINSMFTSARKWLVDWIQWNKRKMQYRSERVICSSYLLEWTKCFLVWQSTCNTCQPGLQKTSRSDWTRNSSAQRAPGWLVWGILGRIFSPPEWTGQLEGSWNEKQFNESKMFSHNCPHP